MCHVQVPVWWSGMAPFESWTRTTSSRSTTLSIRMTLLLQTCLSSGPMVVRCRHLHQTRALCSCGPRPMTARPALSGDEDGPGIWTGERTEGQMARMRHKNVPSAASSSLTCASGFRVDTPSTISVSKSNATPAWTCSELGLGLRVRCASEEACACLLMKGVLLGGVLGQAILV